MAPYDVYDVDGKIYSVIFRIDPVRLIAEAQDGVVVQLQSQSLINKDGERTIFYQPDGLPFDQINIQRAARAMYEHIKRSKAAPQEPTQEQTND